MFTLRQCTDIMDDHFIPENHIDSELITYNVGTSLKSSQWGKWGRVGVERV